jgi:hypothetical protein
MTGITGIFANLPLATLTQMQADWTNCLQAIAVAHQSYSMAGRSFTRANLNEVSRTLGEIAYAIRVQTGLVNRTVADMSHGNGGRRCW